MTVFLAASTAIARPPSGRPARRLAAPVLVVMALGLAGCVVAAPPPPAAAPPPASTPAAAPPAAPNVADLVGARASSGEGEMGRRGFTVARQQGLTAFWWNASASACVRTVTANGRYSVVEPVAAASCGR